MISLHSNDLTVKINEKGAELTSVNDATEKKLNIFGRRIPCFGHTTRRSCFQSLAACRTTSTRLTVKLSI